MYSIGPSAPRNDGQSGSAILSMVLVVGLLILIAQGIHWFGAKASARFLGTEKKKIVAMQMAEAGVEDNIAALARRTIRASADMPNLVTFENKPLDGGTYTSTLSAVSMSESADTVDLVSRGKVGNMQQTIRARLKLKKFLDTALTVLTYVEPDTTASIATVTVIDTVASMPNNPASTPALNTTAAYASCMSGAPPSCRVCHLPNRPDTLNMNVITQMKAFIPSHNSHLGDYITMDGTCDLYRKTLTFTSHTELDTTYAIVDNNIYDTTAVVDTSVKVKVLSWR